MGIEEIRAEIDAVDQILAEKTAQRLGLMEGVARYKRSLGLPLLDAERERQVIAKNAARFPDHLRPYGEKFFYHLMELCKQHQAGFFPKETPAAPGGAVGFQGVEGSFSHEALESCFGLGAQTQNYPLFEDVTKAIEAGEILCGVLPIENSSTGAINEVYDLLLKYKLFIVGEKILPIRHNLLGLKGASIDNIREAHSHIQGLRQCAQFLRARPHILPVEATNTAAAARMVAERGDLSLAAIASLRAGQIYGLEVLAPSIHNSEGNSTRFIIAAREPQKGPADKASACLMLAHRPGALCSVLRVLEDLRLNMTKLESRPIPERPWEYIFYLDFETGGASLSQTLASLAEVSSSFVFLGAYRADRGQG